MRLIRLALPLCLLTAFSFACGDDDGGGGGVDAGDDIDGSTDEMVDADTRPTSGTCGIVASRTVVDAPIEGQTVLFSNPDGSLIGTETTDTNGAASRDDCVRDTMISLVVLPTFLSGGKVPPLEEPGLILTYTHVQPEETVYSGPEPGPSTEAPTVTVNVALPADTSGIDDFSSFDLRAGPCGNDSATAPGYRELDVSPECWQGDGTIDVLVTARTFQGEVAAYALISDIPTTSTPVSVNAPALTPVADSLDALVASKLPATQGAVGVGQWIGDLQYAGQDEGWDPGDLTTAQNFNGLEPAVGTASYASGKAMFSSRGELDSFFRNGTPPSTDMRFTEVTWGAPIRDTNVVDMSKALPELTDVVVTTPADGRPVLNWVANGSLADAAGGVFGSALVDQDGPLLFWIVVTGDAQAGSVRAPALPESAAAAIFDTGISFIAVPLVGSVFGFDYQSYSDLITTEGFGFERVAGTEGTSEYQFGPFPFLKDDLPAPIPSDVESTALRSVWISRLFGELTGEVVVD